MLSTELETDQQRKKRETRESWENMIGFVLMVASIAILLPPVMYCWKLWANYWGF